MFPGASVYAYNNLWTKELGTNNASLIVFLDIGGYKICLPGDLEADGWEMLLKEEGFVEHLESSSILIAPHHGRSNGYCERVMKNCRFHLVFVSDSEVKYATQEDLGKYRKHVPVGVDQGDGSFRFIYTTRNDGHIRLSRD